MDKLNTTPHLKAEGGGYRFTQAMNGRAIVARISRIRKKKDDIRAEIALSVDGKNIHRSSPTLTSASALDVFRRTLQRRLPQKDWGIDFDIIVETLSGMVLDAYRAGPDEVILSTVEPQPEARWKISPFLLEQETNILYGPGGCGKSMIACWFAVLIDSGHVDTSHGVTVKPGKVLYLDFETTEFEIAGRIQQIARGMEIKTPTNIVYRRCFNPLVDEVDRISEILERHKFNAESDVIIIDSLGIATGGGLKDEDVVIPYYSALRQLGYTSLTISHTTKANESGEGKNLFGSVYSWNEGRSIIEVQKPRDTFGNTIDVVLSHRKVNNAPNQKVKALSIEFADQAVTFKDKDPIDVQLGAQDLSIPDLVYRIIARSGRIEKKALLPAIIDRRGVNPDDTIEIARLKSSVSSAIHRHIKTDKLVQVGADLSIKKSTTPVPPPKEEELWPL